MIGCWAPKASSWLPWLGDDDDLMARIRSDANLPWLHLALAGAPGGGLRKRIVQRLELPGRPLPWATLIHPLATLSASVTIGVDCFVSAGAILNPGSVVLDHALVNTGAIVEHDCRIGTGAHLAPGCVLGGKVEVGDWAVVGLGAVVRDHIKIGEDAVVGMGAVVVKDVPAGAIVIGNPARPMVKKG